MNNDSKPSQGLQKAKRFLTRSMLAYMRKTKLFLMILFVFLKLLSKHNKTDSGLLKTQRFLTKSIVACMPRGEGSTLHPTPTPTPIPTPTLHTAPTPPQPHPHHTPAEGLRGGSPTWIQHETRYQIQLLQNKAILKNAIFEGRIVPFASFWEKLRWYLGFLGVVPGLPFGPSLVQVPDPTCLKKAILKIFIFWGTYCTVCKFQWKITLVPGLPFWAKKVKRKLT